MVQLETVVIEEKGSHLQPPDIEHAAVLDDPREWSQWRKRCTLALVATATMIATLGANIYNPAIAMIMKELNASDAEISLSLSLFIVTQGAVPLLWAAVSEVKGRKTVYLLSMTIYMTACAVCGASRRISLLIGMRLFQACGGSAVLTIGAGTLADIYDPRERGTMLGIYYAAPLLGPALGPIIGGILTQVWSWRATFYFLSALGCVLLFPFLLFKDTFRRERSTSYQAAVSRHRQKNLKKPTTSISREVPLDGSTGARIGSVVQAPSSGTENFKDTRLSASDINPFPQLIQVLRRKNNVALVYSLLSVIL